MFINGKHYFQYEYDRMVDEYYEAWAERAFKAAIAKRYITARRMLNGKPTTMLYRRNRTNHYHAIRHAVCR